MKFLLILVCVTSFGQSDHGRLHVTVLDADTNQPIPFANVYLNTTTIGASTNEQGETSVIKIPFGTYQLVVSEVGHTPYHRQLVVNSTEIINLTVKLKSQMLDVVTVVGTHDSKWKHQLDRFEKQFFGLDHFKQCEITNPSALEFEDKKDQLIVKSKEPLKITNNYLGYDLDFVITNCYFSGETFNITGFARFVENKGDEKQLAKWKKNREKTYRGSPQHFLKSVFDSSLYSNGYEVYADITGEDKIFRGSMLGNNVNKTIVIDTIAKRVTLRSDGMYAIRFPARLEIHYRLKSWYPPVYRDVNYAVSWMEAKKGTTVVVNSRGFIQNSKDVSLIGAMSNFRVAEWLPLDYNSSNEFAPDPSYPVITQARQNTLLEKPYVQTDRDYYYNNETMWLKGYMCYLHPNLKDTLSKTAYVELSDATGKVVTTKRYEIEGGKFNGDIVFDKDWKPGFYQLRAYTSWMLNFDSRFIFTRTIDLLAEKQAVKTPTNYTLASDTLPNIWLRTDKNSYSAREKITVKIDVTDSLEFPTASDLSISVTDVEQSVPHRGEKSIINNYFFDDKTPGISAKKLTHEIEYGIPFNGRFFEGKKPMQGTLTFYQDSTKDPIIITTNEDGLFKENLFFTDTLQFWAWALSAGKKKAKGFVVMDTSRVRCPGLLLEPLALDVYSADNNNDLRRISTGKTTILPEFSLKAKKIVPSRSSARPVGYGDHRITGDWVNNNGFRDIYEAIAAKVPGSIYDPTRPAISFVTGTLDNLAYGGAYPLIVVDGVPGIFASKIPMRLIDYIDITKFTVGSRFGQDANGGLIEIHTKKPGTNGPREFDKSKLQEIKWVGYSTTSTFESPDYSKPPENDYYDYRPTIYWSPSLTTNGKETATISFYAADAATRYRIVVEGVTATGEPVHAEEIVEVVNGR